VEEDVVVCGACGKKSAGRSNGIVAAIEEWNRMDPGE
jgi:hypothetical protein